MGECERDPRGPLSMLARGGVGGKTRGHVLSDIYPPLIFFEN